VYNTNPTTVCRDEKWSFEVKLCKIELILLGVELGNAMKYFVLVSLLAVAGCATPYQSKGFTGGYSEVQLDENVFKVSFRGNGYTSKERAANFALLRAGEVALRNGFKYFIIADLSNSTRDSSYTTPTQTTTNMNYNSYGSYGYGSANSRTSGGQTYHISKPTTTNTIVCFKEKPEIQGLVYNAEFLVRSLKEEYSITDGY